MAWASNKRTTAPGSYLHRLSAKRNGPVAVGTRVSSRAPRTEPYPSAQRRRRDAGVASALPTTRGREKDRVKDRVRCHPLHLPPRIADFGLAFCRRCPILQAMLRPSAMYA